MIAGLVMLLAGVLGPAIESSVPNAVIERFVDTAVHQVRVTMFDNRVVVFSVREGEDRVLFRRATLSETEYSIYIDAIREWLPKLSPQDYAASIQGMNASGRLVVAVDADDVIDVRFSPLQASDQALARINAIVDDLQARVMRSYPAEEEMRNWKPRVGDRVELMIGGFAEVIRLREIGVIVLRHDETGVLQEVAEDGRLEVIRGLVGGEE